jgi:hypothetical protein
LVVEADPCGRLERATSATTDDNLLPFAFPAVERKKVTAAFDDGCLSSDGGIMLLSQAERRLGLAERLAVPKVRFAVDSPLEQAGFELQVPPPHSPGRHWLGPKPLPGPSPRPKPPANAETAAHCIGDGDARGKTGGCWQRHRARAPAPYRESAARRTYNLKAITDPVDAP